MTNQNKKEWQQRSQQLGTSLKSVLFRNVPDVLNEHIHQWHQKIVVQAIVSKTVLRILDVGCGYGRLSIPIMEKFPKAEIIGIDMDAHYIDLYRKNLKKTAFVGTIENLPENIGTFDYIICVTVLMYLDGEDLTSAIKELFNHLKPEGRLILIENDHSGRPFQTAFGLLDLLRKHQSGTGGRVFQANELDTLLQRNGGKILIKQRLPASTILFLPMYLIGKMFPDGFARIIFRGISLFDDIWGRSTLPSIYIARTICRDISK